MSEHWLINTYQSWPPQFVQQTFNNRNTQTLSSPVLLLSTTLTSWFAGVFLWRQHCLSRSRGPERGHSPSAVEGGGCSLPCRQVRYWLWWRATHSRSWRSAHCLHDDTSSWIQHYVGLAIGFSRMLQSGGRSWLLIRSLNGCVFWKPLRILSPTDMNIIKLAAACGNWAMNIVNGSVGLLILWESRSFIVCSESLSL